LVKDAVFANEIDHFLDVAHGPCLNDEQRIALESSVALRKEA
jgi:hypothetical protein